MKSSAARLAAALGFAATGAALKTLAWLGGSKAAMVDVLTCIANLLSATLAIKATLAASAPPDEEHPYGHERMLLTAVLWIVIIYSFVAGAAAADLLSTYGRVYHVSPSAPVYAAAGTAAYLAAIAAARGTGLAGEAYSVFTYSEVIEGVVTVAAAWAGAEFGSILDYAGAWLLLAYLLYEVWEHAREALAVVEERVPPQLLEEVKHTLENHGLHVKSLRIRPLVPGKYVGDATVEIDEAELSRAHELIDKAARLIEETLGVHLVIHYEPKHREEIKSRDANLR